MTAIRIIDFETTGLEPPAEVCEVGHCDLVKGESGWLIEEPQSYLCKVQSIPPEVRAIHHITAEETARSAPFDGVKLIESSSHCAAIAAHNMDFELKFIPHVDGKIPLICTYKAALRVWPEAPSHANGALRYWLEDQGKISLVHAVAMPPHRAGPDAYVTAHILRALLNAGATGKELIAWTKEPRLLPTCPLGKMRGKKWADVDAGFLSWMLAQPTMEEDLKWNARQEMARRKGATQ